jgi:SAM-dependent methyltransferase
MSHPAQQRFCKYVKDRWPIHFKDRNVLDVGSLDINGNNRFLFENCKYIGIDIADGANVDIVARGDKYNAPDSSVDTIISTECFEHDMYWDGTLKNIVRILKSGGLFLFTCASTGREEHGTNKSKPSESPFTSQIQHWEDYYKNLEEADIRNALDIEQLFSAHEFHVDTHWHDIYFWGLKK